MPLLCKNSLIFLWVGFPLYVNKKVSSVFNILLINISLALQLCSILGIQYELPTTPFTGVQTLSAFTPHFFQTGAMIFLQIEFIVSPHLKPSVNSLAFASEVLANL